MKSEKTGWETTRDAPCWNQPRQREANCGFMMNMTLKVAKGIQDKRTTPYRYGNSIYYNEMHCRQKVF